MEAFISHNWRKRRGRRGTDCYFIINLMNAKWIRRRWFSGICLLQKMMTPTWFWSSTRDLSLSQQWTLIINRSLQFFIWKNYVPISTYNYCPPSFLLLLISWSFSRRFSEGELAKTGITAVMIRSMGYFNIHSATVQFCNLQQNPLKNHNL